MIHVSMSDFLNHCLIAGPGRVRDARRIKTFGGGADFYRPVRETIVDMHEKGLWSEPLDQMVASLVDPREKRIFPRVVRGYKKFLCSARMTWFEPPMRDWPLGPLTVRVNPEVGLLIDGRPHAIKLYFGSDEIAPWCARLTTQILCSALASTWPGTVFAVLDVRRAKLFTARPRADHEALLRAEAACLGHLWGSL
jgi:hypothetical protein